MPKRLSIYATPGHVSVTIQNGASRETSGNDFPAVVAAMHPEDRVTLAQFCAGIIASLETEQPQVEGGAK